MPMLSGFAMMFLRESGAGSALRPPRLPVFLDLIDEVLRRLSEETRSLPKGVLLQLLPAPANEAEQSVQRPGAAKGARVRRQCLTQDEQVMVVSQRLGQLVRLFCQVLHDF